MDTPRARVSQWLKDGSSLLTHVLNDYGRASAALGEAQRECKKLRDELAALHEENKRFRAERSGVLDTIAAALSTASAALRRLPDMPEIVTVDPVTTGGDLERRPQEATVTPAPVSPPPAIGTTRPKESAPPRILVVDDEESFRSMVAAYLRNLGYQVTTARTGEEALHLLYQNSPPQLVLLDLAMPGIGGMRTLERIKAQFPDLNVLMVTGNDDRESAQEALALGAADYVKKPFDLPYLDAVLHIYAPLAEVSPTDGRPAGDLAASRDAATLPSPPPKSPFTRP
jgi:CheY-like chemotaxis protein